MTDSNQVKLISRRVLTPDRASYFIPVTIGLLVSIIFSLILLRPLLIRKSEVYQTLITYRKKTSELSLVEKQYELTKKNLNKALKQKSGLLKLVAGHSELKTLLSMLNIIADSNQITILGLVPQPIEFSAPPSNLQTIPSPNSASSKTLGLDPLLVDKIIKYPYKIKLEGYFINLLAFLRQLEDLEIITLNSSIKIDNKSNDQSQTSQNSSNKIKASFIISAYGNAKS